jgi:hypothetical protein
MRMIEEVKNAAFHVPLRFEDSFSAPTINDDDGESV